MDHQKDFLQHQAKKLDLGRGRVDTLDRLRVAEREYRDLFDHAVEGIFRFAGDGRLLAANPALARMLGYDTPAQLMEHFNGPPETRLDDLARREEFLARLRETGEVRTPIRCRRAASTVMVPVRSSSWVTGTRSMAQMGQVPGTDWRMEGCMGQV